ncbi:MAG: hypothetical protein WKH64_01310 [Chloroflexia bacterium]
MCSQPIPNEFWLHHGSPAKGLREHVETMLKERSNPVSVVCTDAGDGHRHRHDVLHCAADSPPSVACCASGLVARAARRGCGPAHPSARRETDDPRRAAACGAGAEHRLLLARWYEPPAAGDLHLSTLVQRSSRSSHSTAARAAEAYSALCGPGLSRG